jgi:prenylcysteine oxidase / farnesylcysteine lyase
MTTSEVVSHLIHHVTPSFGLEVLEGSIAVFPYNDTAYEPVELGASIFVQINKNLWRAVNEFNLSFYGSEDEDGDKAIWDGEQILHAVCFLVVYYLVVSTSTFQVMATRSWLNDLKFLWRYGYRSPTKAKEL